MFGYTKTCSAGGREEYRCGWKCIDEGRWVSSSSLVTRRKTRMGLLGPVWWERVGVKVGVAQSGKICLGSLGWGVL